VFTAGNSADRIPEVDRCLVLDLSGRFLYDPLWQAGASHPRIVPHLTCTFLKCVCMKGRWAFCCRTKASASSSISPSKPPRNQLENRMQLNTPNFARFTARPPSRTLTKVLKMERRMNAFEYHKFDEDYSHQESKSDLICTSGKVPPGPAACSAASMRARGMQRPPAAAATTQAPHICIE